jgi:hypothetical protein
VLQAFKIGPAEAKLVDLIALDIARDSTLTRNLQEAGVGKERYFLMTITYNGFIR